MKARAKPRAKREVYVVVDVGAVERNLVRRIRAMIDRGEIRETSDFLEAELRLFGVGGLAGLAAGSRSANLATSRPKTAPPRKGKTSRKAGAGPSRRRRK